MISVRSINDRQTIVHQNGVENVTPAPSKQTQETGLSSLPETQQASILTIIIDGQTRSLLLLQNRFLVLVLPNLNRSG